MFTDNSDVVSLGIPSSLINPIKVSIFDHEYFSRIGGYATWHDPSAAPAEFSKLRCGSCGKVENIVLVAQIYAPVNFDRSIYLFCCNTRKCSSQSIGWIVVRNQEINKATSNILTPSVKKESNANASIWNMSNLLSINDIDIEKMLNDRDEKLNGNQFSNEYIQPVVETNSALTVMKSSTITSVDEKIDKFETVFITQQCLPCWRIEECQEHWNDSNLKMDEDEIEDILNQAEKDHIQLLLKAYIADEEDQISPEKPENDDEDEKINLELKLSGESTKEKVERYFQHRIRFEPRQIIRYAYGGQPLWTTDPNPLSTQNSSIVTTKRLDSTASVAVDGVEWETTTSKKKGDTIHKQSKQNQNLSHMKALSVEACQSCNQTGLIPNCEFCGSKRVFEMQLMPTLLSYLSNHYLSNNEMNQPSIPINQSSLDSLLGDGMDFGVVAIWSCPNSCAVSSIRNGEVRYATEVAIVQPPCDGI